MIAAERADVTHKADFDLRLVQSRIRERMEALGISGNSLSRKAGLGISYVNDVLKGATKNPSLSSLAAIAQAADADVGYIIGQQLAPREAAERPAMPLGSNVVALSPQSRGRGEQLARVPLYAAPWPDAEGLFPMADIADEATSLPYEPVSGGYAVMVPDDRMAPRYATGEKVFVNPKRPIAPGSYVVVRLVDGRGMIRRIKAIDLEHVVLHDLAGGAETSLARAQISTIHRITAACEA